MNYVTGKVIKELREKNGLTQKELAKQLQVSDKTISKWENERGLPDIGILTDLAKVLKVSVAELLAGNYITNENKEADEGSQQAVINFQQQFAVLQKNCRKDN